MFNKLGDNLFELLQTSTLVTSLLAVMVAGTACYLFIIRPGDLPPQLWLLLGIVFGFFFGAKVQVAQQQTAKQIQALLESRKGKS